MVGGENDLVGGRIIVGGGIYMNLKVPVVHEIREKIREWDRRYGGCKGKQI